MKFFTIGVYGSTEQKYFQKLIDNKIDTFCDIRQRRGIRGSEYSFANHKKLHIRLNELDIKYLHFIDLAPTVEIRKMQKEADLKQGESKQTRDKLGDIFTISYKNRILNKFDFDDFIYKLKAAGAENIAIFCVEKNPLACHRSLVAEELIKIGFKVEDL